ncbi:Oidioi.mRNA.OKI2018_I69.PAR.g12096.t1.cds [Oikopleura dioica]|uniref:Guanosine-3',5'-bis(diphosphate) 3'-pyrophosphohydrolase MESH1 n=1 Tax=Oikopleura dioica TaxID=34765 RepID=A0ABN7S5F5_OIKDI|nr:Oidioi.mRNA.OKI2018_I69.PAR.g12096.t1.cds [Oikopleura dioica]
MSQNTFGVQKQNIQNRPKYRRKDSDKTPYINHPIGVAEILTEEGGVTDVDILCAALLHDTVEDTDTTFEEIEELFGKIVRDYVDEVTDDKNLEKMERKRLQIVNAPKKTPGAKQVKLADKLYNLRDLNRCTPESWDEERVVNYFKWAKQVVDGLRGANAALESKLDELFVARGV